MGLNYKLVKLKNLWNIIDFIVHCDVSFEYIVSSCFFFPPKIHAIGLHAWLLSDMNLPWTTEFPEWSLWVKADVAAEHKNTLLLVREAETEEPISSYSLFIYLSR